MKVHEFTLYTLVNITNTQKRADVTTKNFNTLINGISLSVQPTYENNPISKLEDLFKRGHKYKTVNIDDHLPEYMIKNKKIFIDYF